MNKKLRIISIAIIFLYIVSIFPSYIFIQLKEIEEISPTPLDDISVQKIDIHDNISSLSDHMRGSVQKIKGIYNISTDLNTTIRGINGGMLYYSLAIGDINKDGKDDIIIGDRQRNSYPPQSRQGAGEIYVIFGDSRANINSIPSLSEADITIYGANEQNRAGGSIASSDIDNDGFDDIIINGGGKVYVIYGKPQEEFSSIIDLNESTGYSHSDLIIYGEGEGFGLSISSNDINGDDFDDIVVGAPFWDNDLWNNDAGRVYVISGSGRSSLGSRKYMPDDADVIINGAKGGFMDGYSVHAGDITNDNKAEIIIGGGSIEVGIFGVYGSENLPSVIDLNNPSFPHEIFRLDGDIHHGFPIFESEDINGDRYNDLIFGTRSDGRLTSDQDRTLGKVYVVYGKDELPNYINLNYAEEGPHPDILFKGDEDRDCLGRGLAAGDIDRNGKADIIAGASHADGIDNLKPYSGETYLIYGRLKEKFNKINYISQIDDAAFYGIDENDFSGETIESGDIDGDGVDDIIIGEGEWFNENEKRDIHIKYGIPTGYGIEMALQDDLQIVNRGESTEYSITVSNNGRYSDVFDFMMVDVPEKWQAELDYYSLPFEFSELKHIVLTITAPDDVRHNEWANITVYGISRGDETVSAFVVARTLMVIQTGVELDNSDTHNGIMPLTSITYVINITNLGSFEDEFEIVLSESPPGWKAKPRPQYVYLLPFQKSRFNLTVTHNNISSPEEEFDLQIRAISLYDYRINTSLNITTYTNVSFKLEMRILNSNVHMVKTGSSTNFTFKILNLCKFSIDVNLSHVSDDSSWEVILSERSIHLKRYESILFNLTVRSPLFSVEGDDIEVIVTATIFSKPFLKYSNLTITIVSYENELSVKESYLYCYGYPNNYTIVNFTVTNIGTSDLVSFKLLELPMKWHIEFIPSTIYLNTNESKLIEAKIFIAQDALNGDHQIKFNLVSGEFDNLINVKVYVNQTFGITIDSRIDLIDIMPGRNVTGSFSVKNTGNGVDKIGLSSTGNYSNWMKFDISNFELANGESRDVTVIISIPLETVPAIYIFELMANSSIDPSTIELFNIICRISKPDLFLSVSPVEESPQIQIEFAFKVMVYNRGNINISEDVKVYLKVDDILISESIINNIQANNEKLIVMRWHSQVGSHNVTFIIDPDDTIPETNELNNTISFNIDVRGKEQLSNPKTAVLLTISILLIIIIISALTIFFIYNRKIKQFDNKYRCSILEPISGSELNGVITIKGKASDKTIRHIFLQFDEDRLLKVPIENLDWKYQWDTTEFDNGLHSISIKLKKLGSETPPVKIDVFIKNN